MEPGNRTKVYNYSESSVLPSAVLTVLLSRLTSAATISVD
jgi:hypothetical protein